MQPLYREVVSAQKSIVKELLGTQPSGLYGEVVSGYRWSCTELVK